MIPDEKYIVFKHDEFYQMMGQFLPKGNTDCAPIAQDMVRVAEDTRLSDAVVISMQDVFASPALYVYAHSIALVAGMIRASGDELGAKRLQDIADYFAERAEEAQELACKLPD